MRTNQLITAFIEKSLQMGDLEALDTVYTINKLLNLLKKESYQIEKANFTDYSRLDILDELVEIAVKEQVIEDLTASRDILAAEIMDLLTPKPSEVNDKFWQYYKKSPKEATDYFYTLSRRNNYIKTRELAKNIFYYYDSDYGQLEITINLSKPEKDAQEIARAAQVKKEKNYPSNYLVVENEGFKGHLNHPGRTNHRIIRMDLMGDAWGFQYSPYAYYREHSIFLAIEHRPMNVNPQTIRNLLEIVSQFPHYFVGSNAGLPIVGGSILSHDHYQGGRYDFPIQKAAFIYSFELPDCPTVEAGIIDWPMSVIRLRTENRKELIQAATKIFEAWKDYSNPALNIYAKTGELEHNAITPIARRLEDKYELDIVLRNNRTSGEYPDGIFHPHADLHHIKRENIGLIEVMGLAILPARLKKELAEVKDFLLGKKETVSPIHQNWADHLKKKEALITNENVDHIIKEAVGAVFQEVLEDAGVFKRNQAGEEAFIRFVEEHIAN